MEAESGGGGELQVAPTLQALLASPGPMPLVEYRYELRRGDEVIATGHLSSRARPLEVGERIEVGGRPGIVRTIEPLLRTDELRLVVVW